MRIKRYYLVLVVFLLATSLRAQQVALTGLRSLNHAGAFHGLRQDTAGNLYTLFDAHDGVRLLKLNAAGTQLLAQVQIGQAGDTGIALDLDAAGNVYVAGTSTSQGSITGTTGTAFPNRSDSTTNSFVARFTPALALQWLTFVGSGKTAVTAICVTTSTVYITGGIFAATLPVTSGGIQQAPAIGSSGNGFVEAFTSANGMLRYATYLTGANGDTSPAAIVADASGNTYIAGTTTATGYPTTAALVPVIRTVGTNVSGFVTELDPAGDGFLFSTFIPGTGIASIALDSGSLLLSGNIAAGLFPLSVPQTPIAPLLNYQTLVRLSLDGSSVESSTLLAPGTESVVTSGGSGSAWAYVSAQGGSVPPLLPVQPLESIGNAFALRAGADGRVDRVSRTGGLPVNNSAYASLPALAGGIAVAADGTVALAGSIQPTLSSALLNSVHYDLPLAQAPNTALPATVRDTLPLASCSGSACSGSAALLARLAPSATSPQLALSADDHPNLTLRNLGLTDASALQITASGYTVTTGCGPTLAPGAECSIALAGTAAGSITVGAANFPAFTTALPSTVRTANAIAVLPHELDFGIQTSASAAGLRILTVRNLSSTQQTFPSQTLNTSATGYTLRESSSTCTAAGDGVSKILSAGSTCTITLALAAGTDSGSDGAVTSHWQVGTTDVLITGYAQAAATSLSATTIDFGRQFTGGLRAPRYLYISNASDTGKGHATVSSTNAAFTITDECPFTLQPRSICRIALAYNATSSPSSDALSLAVDGATVTVLGETLPQPSINSAAANPNLTLSAAVLTFVTPVTVTTASNETQTVIIGNSGASAFALAMAVTGDFTFATDCPATLPGGATCKATLHFTPSQPGARQGLLSVTAGSSGPSYVELAGTGTAILPQNNGLYFGDIPLNTPAVQWLKVQQALVMAKAVSPDPSFRVLLVEDTGYGHGQPPASAFASTASGSCLNCYLGIEFLPTSVGTHVASIAFSSSTSGMATTVAVSGSGVPLMGLVLTPVLEDFGPVPVHSASASTVFQLQNATSATVQTTSVAVSGDFAIAGDATGGLVCASGASLQPGASCFIPSNFSLLRWEPGRARSRCKPPAATFPPRWQVRALTIRASASRPESYASTTFPGSRRPAKASRSPTLRHCPRSSAAQPPATPTSP